jgi:prophage antirepressor-like protein
MEKALQKLGAVIFEKVNIRRVWQDEKWYFSVIDVVAALTGSERPRRYWNDLKKRLTEKGSQLSDKIGQLKMPAEDARKNLEARTGEKVVTNKNYLLASDKKRLKL